MAQDNENEFPLPNKKEGQEKRQTARHLPRFFRTNTNKKFLGGTMDPLTQPGKLSRINAYVGRKDIPNYSFDDNYLEETSSPRQYYQLETAVINEDPVNGDVRWYADYIDYINSLRYFGANVSNHSRLNKQEAYAWDPQIDWDKIVNYREYYWLPNGPEPVTIFGELEATESTYTVTASNQGDNTAYIFSPDGLTANPRLTLYRGIKYRFEINTPGKPFAIKTRVEPGDSWFYDRGVSERNVETGIVEFEIPYEAPDLLYYMDNKDPETAGMIDIRSIQESAFLNVEDEIVGKKTFTSSSGIKFINGLRVKFAGRVSPEKYATGFWYVEGVGSKIKLINQSDLETPAVYGAQLDVPFDDQPFDSLPWDNADNYPLTKDYIVINRASRDRNTWSRNNRWFHRNVLETAAKANNRIADLDQSSRATRPIIEFEPDIKLFNHGYISKTDIDLVDTITTDVFSTIEGSTGYIVDGEQLLPGYRVLFTADPDPLVNGRIFEVKQIVAALKNGRRQLTLQEINETDPVEGQIVYITKGNNKGSSYHYENGSWKLAQKKNSVNQAPLFDLFDENQISYGDQVQYSYNTFKGTRLFGYKIGTGSDDSELGFPLSYRNINNIGDIEFEFDLQKDTWNYLNNDILETVQSYSAFLRKLTPENNFVYNNGWVQTDRLTEQNVVRILKITQATDEIPIDVFDNSASLTDLRIRVYVNNNKVNEFIIDENGNRIQNLTLITKNDYAYIKFSTLLNVNDKVVYKVRSIAPKNTKGYYEIPLNWQNNPLNDTVDNFTFGEVIDHLRTIVENVREFEGTFPGIGNLANIGPVSQYGRKFMQHTGPMSLSAFLMVDRNANIVKSLRWTARKYSEFKKEFIKLAKTEGFDGNPRDIVDQILSKYSASKYIEISAFYFSDMAPFGASTIREYKVVDPRLPIFVIDSTYTPLSQNKRTILVYLNEEQLLYPRDYDFDTSDAFVRIKKTLSVNDTIVIKDYASTDGCYIPFTPSKLGLYPMYEPSMYLDDTYREPTMVIQGHDGSITKAYGDYRDDLILELERRIFNSRRVEYDSTMFNIDDVMGGYYRRNDFTKSEINDILLSEFLRWNSIPDFDFTTNNFWKETESFTYNYNRSNAPNDAEPLYGFWRGIYKYFYDTDRPHSHPWEIQGFTIKPIWWDDVYGLAPYTSDNKILWDNIEAGFIADPLNPRSDLRYSRPGMGDYLPVDEFGNLLSPLDSNLAKGFSLVTSKDNFNFGDQSPVETAWRRSSEYPYAVMIILSVLRGAEFIGKTWDRFTIKRNLAGQVYNTTTGKKLRPVDLPFSDERIGELSNTMTSGIANFVDEYVAVEKFIDFDYYKELMRGLGVKLSYRLGGFTSKEKIKVLLDSRSPNASGTVFLPIENYKVFYNKSAPVDTVNYSGVIIEKKTNGYSVKGYDTEKNYFEIYPHRATRTDPIINVGGISETFVLWEIGNFYNRGQIIRVDNSGYYRAKVSHTAVNFKEDIDKWQPIPKLPIVGGRDAVRRTKFFASPIKIPYGTVFTDIQSVVDFLLGYQERLKAWGFEFEDYSKDLELPLNWITSVKEFMFWTLQNWAAGSVITLSPAATKLTFKSKIIASVDTLDDDFYDYSIFKADGQPLRADLTNVYREDNGYEIIPSGEIRDGIFHVRTNLIYKEHVLLFDNVSVFNDVIYDVVPGYRQGRLKLVGFKTSNWNGGYTSPGFIYDEAKIFDWQADTDYNIGDIVSYQNYYFSATQMISGNTEFDFTKWKQLDNAPTQGLIPNFDYKIEQFRDFYSLDNSNFDTQQQNLSRHLIGYQPRQYLENIIIDDVSSYKFYQGFIKEKGTANSVTKLFDALRSSGFSSINIKEEWAFKVGDFGASEAYSEIEFPLNESKFLYNPQDVVLTQNKTEFEDLTIYNVPASSVAIKPVSYDSKPFPMVRLDHSQNDYGVFKYKVAGYVRDDDVDHILYDETALLNYDVNLLKEKDKIWVGNTPNGDWTVYEYLNSNVIVTNWEASGNTLRLFCDNVPDLKINQIITLKNLGVLDSTYKVLKIYSNIIEVFTFNSAVFKLQDFSTAGQLFKFESSRYPSAREVSTRRYNELKIRGEKIWIDEDKNGNWRVLENVDAFVKDELPTIIKNPQQLYGYDVKISENKLFMFVSAPKNNSGLVVVYSRPNNLTKWTFLQNLILPGNISSDTDTELFGTSIDVSYDGKLLVISAPNLSNLKTYYRGTFNPTATYNPRDVVRYNGKLWKNLNKVVGDGSTISIGSQDWEEVDYYSFRARPANFRGPYEPLFDYNPGDTVSFDETTWRCILPVRGNEFNTIDDGQWEVDDTLNQMKSQGTSSGLVNQGAVFIFYYNEVSRRFREETFLGAFEPENNEKFGNKVKLRFDGTRYWLFVGAKEYNGNRGRVHIFNKDPINGWVFNSQRYLDFTNIIGTYPSIFDPTIIDGQYGYDVDANASASKIAVSAPYLQAGAVYVFERVNTDFQLVQVIDSYTFENNITPVINTLKNSNTNYFLEDNEIFGYSIFIRNDSLYVSTPNDDSTGYNVGSVYYFDYINNEITNPYRLRQIIIPPSEIDNERFGTKIDVTPSGDIMAVSSIGGDYVVETKFDTFSDRVSFNEDSTRNYILDDNSETLVGTTFDNSSTNFYDKVPYTGAVYVYNRIDDDFIYADKLLPSNVLTIDNNFGFSIDTNDDCIVVGTPNYIIDNQHVGTVFVFNYDKLSWSTKHSQNSVVDISKFKKSFIYDTKKSVLLNNLDFIDPAKGRIPGLADQEIKYQTYYDPAIYEFGVGDTIIVDQSSPWSDEHVGEIWWNLSNVKWTWYEQGDSTYRNNNWGRIFPGSQVEIYEWVESIYLPTRYAELADTEEGLAQGISGIPKDSDDFTYSTKTKYDPVSGTSATMYYFWVKNKTIIPRTNFRNISAADIAKLIIDPKSQGYRFVAITGENSLSLTNIKPKLNDTDVSVNLQFYTIDNIDLLVHREYALVAEDDPAARIPPIVENKWFDSLIGYNVKGQRVPDTKLSFRQRYGASNDPRQSWFKNRFEALKQTFEYVNSVLAKRQIVDDINFSNLLKKDPSPTINSGDIDTTVDILDDLRFIGTANLRPAKLSVIVSEGSIANVFILDSGYGYGRNKTYSEDQFGNATSWYGPKIKVLGTGTGAELQSVIDSQGKIISVQIIKTGKDYDSNTTSLTVRGFTILVLSDIEANGGWSLQEWDTIKKKWSRVKTQAFDVTRYWSYKDWYATDYGFGQTDFGLDTDISYLVENTKDLNGLPCKIGELVKISNAGFGNWLLLIRKAITGSPDFTDDYDVVGKQNATIQFSERLYNLNKDLGYDSKSTFDLNTYDRYPTTELRIILEALRDNILVDDLREEYIRTFFNSVQYAMHEHLYVDWAFKTSFVKANHTVGTLRQRTTFQSDVLDSYQQFLEEAKPYKTKIREFVSSYDALDNAGIVTTDFDLPSYYDSGTRQIERTTPSSSVINKYPWKNWLDNNTFEITEIVLETGGQGYLSVPKVIITGGGGTGASATAYIASGKVYKIVIDNPGSGYTSSPTIFISGGNGDIEENRARAIAKIGNSKVRTNRIGIRYDRNTFSYTVNDFKYTDVFVGTGNQKSFKLTYAPEIEKSKFNILVNNIEYYGSQYDVVVTESVHDTYTALEGSVVFKLAPTIGARIVITYDKNIKLYSAADRINYAYNPKEGMYGKDLGQLMTGVDYGGVQLTSIDFEIGGGWDVLPWDVSSWDNVLTSNDDYVVASDGTTLSFTLPYIPAVGDVINIYINDLRIDDPYFSLYDGSTEQPNGRFTAPAGTIMDSFVGDGIENVINIPPVIDLLSTDLITFRKSTSDGTILPTDRSLIDSFILGGTLDTTDINGRQVYNNAAGILADEIIIDGDEFVTADTSHGPEELVQGQVVDSLDIKVYHAPAAGGPNVSIRNYTGDGVTDTFAVGQLPGTVGGLFLLVNDIITDVTIDFTNNTVTAETVPPNGAKIAVISIDTAGYDITDKVTFIGDGNTKEFLTAAQYNGGNVSGFVTVNGVSVNFIVKESDDAYEVSKRTIVEFEEAPEQDAVIQIMMFNGTIQKWSEIITQSIPIVPDQFVYTLDPIPAIIGPLSAMVFVVIDNEFLQAPDFEYFTYDGSSFVIPDLRYAPNTLNPQDIDVYNNGVKLTPIADYLFDSAQNKITLTPGVASNGDLVTVEIVKNSDFRIADNQVILNDKNYTTVNKIEMNVTTFTNHDILKVKTSNVGFKFITGFDLLGYDIIKFDVTSTAINTSGIFTLPRFVSEKSGVFVALNRLLLTPNVDYVVLDNKRQIKVLLPDILGGTDYIQIITFNDQTVRPSYGFKIFKDMVNRYHYKRLDSSATTMLMEPLAYLDTKIVVYDASVLPDPSRENNLPGIIIIDGERIEYLIKDGNILRQLRRGTLGTGIKDFYPTGTEVVDMGILQTIPYNDEETKKTFISDGSTQIFELDFFPRVTPNTVDDDSTGIAYTDWYRETIPPEWGQSDELEVFVAGRRLRKSPVSIYDQTLGQDSYNGIGDKLIEAEFSVNQGTAAVRLTQIPEAGSVIVVVYKKGKIWQRFDENASLVFSNSSQAKFLTAKSVNLPK